MDASDVYQEEIMKHEERLPENNTEKDKGNKKYAVWKDHSVIGYVSLSEDQKNELNSLPGIGIYIGIDKKTNPEKYLE